MHNSSTRAIPGVVLIILGAGFLLESLGFGSFSSLIGQWWPIVGIAIALLAMRSGNMVSGGIIAGVSVLLLLNTLGVLNFSVWSLFWPGILILVGLNILTGRRFQEGGASSDSDKLNAVAIFGGAQRHATGKTFSGGEVTALFGGVEIDLRETEVVEGARIHVTAFCGGIEIKVPKGTRVEWRGLALFGGFGDEITADSEAKRVLVVDGLAVFGGVGVKN